MVPAVRAVPAAARRGRRRRPRHARARPLLHARSRSTGRRSCSRTTSRCGRRTRDGCGRCSTAGRLEVGPSYVLPDEILVGGESLVRNLLLGRRVCRRFGVEPSGAGYLPDSFGHPAQLPQILAGFGIRTFLFSRGLGDEIDDVGVVFRWRAGPAEVVACQMLPHYDNFARLTWYHDAEERVRAIVERFGELVRGAGQDEILLANGSDHLPIEPELPEILAGLEQTFGAAFRIGRYDEHAPARRRAAGARGRARRQPAPERPARRQLGADLPQAGERARRAAAALDRDGRRAADAARGRAVPGRRAAARVARPAPQPPARLDLRLLVRRGAPGHARPLRAARPDARLRRARGARSRRRAREHAPVPAAPRSSTGRLVELDGFSGRRPEPLVSRRAADSTSRRSRSCSSSRTSRTSATCTRSVPAGKAHDGAAGRLARGRQTRSCSSTSCRGSGSRRRSAPSAGLDRVELTSVVENEAEDHRLRVLVRSADGADEVRAESQFAVVRRPLSPPRSARGLGRAAGADGAHARRRRARAARPAHEGAAGVRGVAGRAAPDAAALRRHDLAAERAADAPACGRAGHRHAGRPVPRPPRLRVRAPLRRRRALERGARPGEPGLPHRLPPRRPVRAAARARRRRRLLVPQAGGGRRRPRPARLQPEPAARDADARACPPGASASTRRRTSTAASSSHPARSPRSGSASNGLFLSTTRPRGTGPTAAP